MTQAKKGSTVKVHYTGKLEDGTIFDSSADREPLEFTLGEGKVIPGFENAVMGMSQGEKKTVTVSADNAYGSRNDDMIAQVDRKQLPSDLDVEVGQRLRIPHPNGKPIVVEVVEISDDTVILDGNHPLAGKDLTFDIELVEVA